MIARVLDGEKEFQSYIFAKFADGFKSTVIVFDSSENRYKHLQMYSTKPYIRCKVFIIDCNRDGWTSLNRDTEGYDWLIRNPTLTKSIKCGKPVAEEYISRAIELNKTIIINEWTEIKTDKDIENLLTAACDFHDSTIKNINYDKDKMTIVFEGCWNSIVILEFEGDIALRYIDNDVEPVYDSSIIFDGKFVYWVDENIKSISDIKDDFIVLRGHSLRWKQILNKNQT